MKTLEQIQDEYAKEQGYKSWWLLNVYCKDMSKHYENIIQIVQDELKKKIASSAFLIVDFPDEEFKQNYYQYAIDGRYISIDEKSILNTENIK